jgi:hypothetical protein
MSFPGFFFSKSWIYIIFYVFALKCLFLKGFQAENGIFALFSTKIRTWQTMPLKVGFIPGFRRLLTDLLTGWGQANSSSCYI